MLENEFMEVNLLSKKEYEDYDLERTFYKVRKFLNHYKKLKYKNLLNIPVKITKNFQLIQIEQTNYGNYNEIDRYIDDEKEFLTINKKISSVIENMQTEERVYLLMHLIDNQSLNQTLQKIGCSKNGIELIKNSCIIKLAWTFDLEIFQGEYLEDLDELRFQNKK